MRTRVAIVIAAVGLSVTVAAVQLGRLPSGSYQRTCDDAAMIGSVLTAHCKDQNGVTIHTRLYVRDCWGDISNEFGELVCNDRRLPAGSFAETCTACRTDGSALRCTCRDRTSKPIKTSLDLASCQWGSTITNKDGHLQCD